MSRPKAITYLVGIAYQGDSLLLFPKPGGFDLPCFQKKGGAKKCLLKNLGELGFEGIEIRARLEPIEKETDGKKERYIGFVFAYEKANSGFKTLPLETKAENAPELAREYLWRADVYAPMYCKMERTVPLLPPEAKKVERERVCLQFHRFTIGKKRLAEFNALCDSAASIRRINEAFVAICNECQVDPNELPKSYLESQKKK